MSDDDLDLTTARKNKKKVKGIQMLGLYTMNFSYS